MFSLLQKRARDICVRNERRTSCQFDSLAWSARASYIITALDLEQVNAKTRKHKTLKPRLHERCFACDGDAIFLKIVASPARGENRMCSHSRTGDATDEKIAEKNREKFNELNF